MQYNHKSKMTFTKPRYMIIIKYIQKTPLFKKCHKKSIKSFLVWKMICQKTSKINKNISNKFGFIFIKKQMQIILRLAALAVYVCLIFY